MRNCKNRLVVEERSKKPLFYLENGNVVFTPEYHIDRGQCCGQQCRHCPYEPLHIQGNSKLQDIYIKNK